MVVGQQLISISREGSSLSSTNSVIFQLQFIKRLIMNIIKEETLSIEIPTYLPPCADRISIVCWCVDEGEDQNRCAAVALLMSAQHQSRFSKEYLPTSLLPPESIVMNVNGPN